MKIKIIILKRSFAPILFLCTFFAVISYGQNTPHNIYPNLNSNNNLPGVNGDGRVGIGSADLLNNAWTLEPEALLHINGWLPLLIPSPVDCNIYREPALRISLEADANFTNMPPNGNPNCGNFPLIPHWPVYGELSMQNNPATAANNGPPNPVIKYSAFAKMYDFVLSTAQPTFRVHSVMDPTLPDPLLDSKGYKFDLIVTSKNPLGSIRFGTTPFLTPEFTVGDLERMTIL